MTSAQLSRVYSLIRKSRVHYRSQCKLDHRRLHTDWPGTEPRPSRFKVMGCRRICKQARTYKQASSGGRGESLTVAASVRCRDSNGFRLFCIYTIHRAVQTAPGKQELLNVESSDFCATLCVCKEDGLLI